MEPQAPTAPAAARSNSRQHSALPILDNERWLGSILIGPAVLYIFLLVGVPFCMALYYSVSNTTTGAGTMSFVGLRNFTAVIGTPKFQTALKNTLVFGVISQSLMIVLANALALLILRIHPQPRSRIPGSACCARSMGAFRFTSYIQLRSAVVTSLGRRIFATAALLTMISTGPKCAAASCIK